MASLEYRGILHIAGPQRLSRYELGEKVGRYAELDPANLTPGFADKSNLHRPRDCTLDITPAQRLLRTPLHSIDEGLALYRAQHVVPGNQKETIAYESEILLSS